MQCPCHRKAHKSDWNILKHFGGLNANIVSKLYTDRCKSRSANKLVPWYRLQIGWQSRQVVSCLNYSGGWTIRQTSFREFRQGRSCAYWQLYLCLSATGQLHLYMQFASSSWWIRWSCIMFSMSDAFTLKKRYIVKSSLLLLLLLSLLLWKEYQVTFPLHEIKLEQWHLRPSFIHTTVILFVVNKGLPQLPWGRLSVCANQPLWPPLNIHSHSM